MKHDKEIEKSMRVMDAKMFRDTYMKGEPHFNFEKFWIVCKFCGSKKVEFGGILNSDRSECWYPEDPETPEELLVCKCHECGNAFALRRSGRD